GFCRPGKRSATGRIGAAAVFAPGGGFALPGLRKTSELAFVGPVSAAPPGELGPQRCLRRVAATPYPAYKNPPNWFL
ncbi:hypothetical protein, partial [Lelliottia wanjuensis]|uniref:hypothetical protein n=1 Tax=Lelliottia wanjuensis TaxID=3050585 RepID=UPI00254BF5FA